ncbi:hypothetical protein D3C80_1963910 [compost metagenome]
MGINSLIRLNGWLHLRVQNGVISQIYPCDLKITEICSPISRNVGARELIGVVFFKIAPKKGLIFHEFNKFIKIRPFKGFIVRMTAYGGTSSCSATQVVLHR